MKKNSHACAVCGKSFPLGNLVSGAAVRDAVSKEILRDHPGWMAESHICRPDLARYRAQYVHSLLESERGELTALEQEVLQSLRDHELLARNVDAEFEQTWSLGERLADRIASFGGSWAFLICFGAFLALWITMNSLVAARPLSVHPAQPRSLLPGRDPGAGHHDESEPPGGEGPAPGPARLPGEPQGRARDPASQREDRPSPVAPVGSSGPDPGDPARAAGRDRAAGVGTVGSIAASRPALTTSRTESRVPGRLAGAILDSSGRCDHAPVTSIRPIRSLPSILAVSCSLALFVPALVEAQPVVEGCEVQSLPGSSSGEAFGTSVSMSGDVALIGAPGTDLGLPDASGAAHVLRWNGREWQEEAVLLPNDPIFDYFGARVALDGAVAVVGASGNSSQLGCAYVYRHDGNEWRQEQVLILSDPGENAGFGAPVSVSGDVIMVGGTDDRQGPSTGPGFVMVYRFDGATWVEEEELRSPTIYGMFGSLSAVEGNRAVLAAPGWMAERGTTFVYEFGGTKWVLTAQLTPPDLSPGERFGESLSLCGDVVMIGAPYDDEPAFRSGAVYAFRFDGIDWVQEQKLATSNVSYFGTSVALAGDLAVIGSHGDPSSGAAPGAAYVFRFDGASWVEQQRFEASDATPLDYFSLAVDTDGTLALISAESPHDFAGAVYSFAISGDCNGNGVADLCDVTSGTSPDANTNGIPDECEVVSIATAVPPQGSARLRVVPNPFRGATTIRLVDGAPAGAAEIFDGAGRRIRTLRLVPGSSVEWDGTDGAGAPAPAGVYFVGHRGDRSRIASVERLVHLR